MSGSALQQRFGSIALFLTPFSALNFGISVTVGDVFLVIAALLNFRRLASFPPSQYWFLLAAPLFIASVGNDMHATWASIGQVCYIYSFVLPFGWCAFADLKPARMARILVCSGISTSLVGAGQFVGLIPPLPTQQIVEFFGGRLVRVSGLANAVNELTQYLAPLAAILPLVQPRSLRTPSFLVILLGMATALSKQAVFGLPGVAWFFYKQGLRQWVTGSIVAVSGLLAVLFLSPELGTHFSERLFETVEYRYSYSGSAIDERLQLLSVAIDCMTECAFVGYGPAESLDVMRRNGQQYHVHVYFLALAMLGGMPAAIFVLCGYVSTLRRLQCSTQPEWTIFLLVVALGLQCHTAMLMSWQSLPLLVCTAVLAQCGEARRDSASSAHNLSASSSRVARHSLARPTSPLRRARSGTGCT